MTVKLICQIAFILRLVCNFLNGYFRCLLVYKLATGQFAEVPHPTGRPQNDRNASIHSNPPPLEGTPNAPVRQGTPWPNSGSAPENLFRERKDWPISPMPTPTPAPTVKTEAPSQVVASPHEMVMLKQVAEKCSWGLHCPICKNEEEHKEDFDSDMQREQERNQQCPQPQSTQHPTPQNNQHIQPQNQKHLQTFDVPDRYSEQI